MKRLLAIIAVAVLFFGLNSCTKEVDTSISLSGTSWSDSDDTATVELTFSDLQFVLTYKALKKIGETLPGEGYVLRGSYEYISPEAHLYCRTIELTYNGKVEAVQSIRETMEAVVVNSTLSLYQGEDFMGTLELKK